MAQLISVKLTNAWEDRSKHVDQLAVLKQQLRAMCTPLPDSLAIKILVAIVEVSEITPGTTAIRSLAEKDINWKDFSSLLIEECKVLKKSPGVNKAAAANLTCGLYQKLGHENKNVYLNPLNPNNRLNFPGKPGKSGKPKAKKIHKREDYYGQNKTENGLQWRTHLAPAQMVHAQTGCY